MLDQTAEYSGAVKDTAFAYTGIAIPRVTGLIGDTGDFYISAGFTYKNAPWGFVPELLRTDFNLRFDSIELTVGRMAYDDPLGYIASGLFDGGKVTFETGMGYFSAGAWYTGLLYKKRANIEMTESEYKANNTKLDYGNFENSYFYLYRNFFEKNGDNHTNDVARLRGTRFVATNEVEQGQRLSESLIKKITGNAQMTARFLYGEYFNFFPTFKIWMATNHKPVIKGTDHGIWRRLKLIPFTTRIPEIHLVFGLLTNFFITYMHFFYNNYILCQTNAQHSFNGLLSLKIIKPINKTKKSFFI